jgi:hypothetical protein
MKRILSVSLGASSRDHVAEVEFLGQRCRLERRGTDGDLAKALELFRQNDGRVDAFGVGGTNIYQEIAGRRYYWKDSRPIREAVRISKIGDGNRIKSVLARKAVEALERHLQRDGRTLKSMPALITAAVDRYSMAEALDRAGCRMVIGDFMFALGLPLPMHSMRTLRFAAALLMPVITRLPFRWFYSVGEKQEKEPEQRWNKYYEEAEVIAGDYLQIRDYMPRDLRGKIVVTNTTTSNDVEELARRGLSLLATTTPRLEGRSFGTNVIEAALLALIDKPQSEITREDLAELIERIPIEPGIEKLNS